MIKTGNDTFIGSTCDFDIKVRCHNQRLYSNSYRYNNTKLYRTIRENDKKWEMIKLHDYPCDNDTELKIEERRVYDALQPTLNELKPYQTAEEHKQDKKIWDIKNSKKKSQYYQCNKEAISERQKTLVICECGKEVSKRNIAKHRKTKKHIELMG